MDTIKIDNKNMFVELVRRNHNFLFTKRKYKNNDDLQVYFFEETPRLLKDLIQLTRKQHDKR